MRYLFLALIVLLTGCGDSTPRFEKYNAGTVELWIGDRVTVEGECRRRGVAAPNDASIYGCTDSAKRVIVSVSDPKVIAHEFCHWTLYTADHNVCRTPLVAGP